MIRIEPSASTATEFRLLGELEVETDGRRLRLGGPKERALLALLLQHPNRFVSRDALIDALWEQAPAGAAHALEARIFSLRAALRRGGAGELLLTRRAGYVLAVDPEQVDARRFERLLAEGRRQLGAGDAGRADQSLSAALACWRGDALADLTFEPAVLTEAERLEELRLGAREARAEARLALGRHTEVVAELEPLVEKEPLREHLRALLMRALYQAGRQADALALYQDGRRRLVDELGIEPGSELERLQLGILRHDPELDTQRQTVLPEETAHDLVREPGSAPSPPPAREQRKLVTVVRCGIGDPVLREQRDPEVLRALLAQRLHRIRLIAQRHGGSVEGLVVDSVTAVFGVPVVHEDDALRAVRAAVEIRAAMAEIGVEVPIGVDTGEVVAGAEGSLAIGPPVEDAGRLQRAAHAGEVLIGAATLAHVAAWVESQAVGPAAGDDEAQAAQTYRLLSVREMAARPHEPRFVGRRRELTLLRRAWHPWTGRGVDTGTAQRSLFAPWSRSRSTSLMPSHATGIGSLKAPTKRPAPSRLTKARR